MWFSRFFSSPACEKTNSLISLSAGVGSVIGLLATIAGFINHLTTTFAGIFTFRFRAVVLMALFLSLIVIVLRLAFGKHRCQASLAAAEVAHYNYGLRDRVFAICSLPVVAVALLLSMTDLQYWRGKEGPLEGLVVGLEGNPLEGVAVDSLNVDRQSVTRSRQVTDTYGRFVLDVMADGGRPVYLSMDRPPGCHLETAIPKKDVDAIGRGVAKTEQASRPTFVFACFAK